jgi:hypothetical protein
VAAARFTQIGAGYAQPLVIAGGSKHLLEQLSVGGLDTGLLL